MLAAQTVAGARLGGPVVAVLLLGALAVLWGRWLTPRAVRRLGGAARTAVEVLLVVVAAGLLAAAGALGWWAAVLGLVAVVLVAAEAFGCAGKRV